MPELSAKAERIAETGSCAPPAAAEPPVTAAGLNSRVVKESFARLMSRGPAVIEYCYARLFAANPGVRCLFRSFARLIWSLDHEPGVSELLGELARDHRRLGATEPHYEAFFAAMRDAARHFLGQPGLRRPRMHGRPRSTSCP